MAVNNAFVDALMQILGNTPQGPAGPLPASTNAIPQPRPAVLPQGSFTPGADQPSLASVIGGAPQTTGRSLLRAMGAGAANLRNTGGDPFMSFGQGFGGATQYYDAQDLLDERRANNASAAALDAEKLQYDRAQDAAKIARDQAKDDADLELRRLAEDRQARSSELANQKTALELRQLARQNGLNISQVLEIERIAQAAGENIIDPAERKAEIDATRTRLLDQATSGQGLSGRTGLSTPEVTATGPNGEKVVLRNGQWVPKE